jgi:septum site-determining protein MinD
MLSSKTRRADQNLEQIKEHLLLTRYHEKTDGRGDKLSAKDVQEILAIKLLGVIPESVSVLKSSNAGIPITLDKESDAGAAYIDAVASFCGEEPPKRNKKGVFSRLFGN